MTSRSTRTWAVFGGCAVLVALALLQVTREVLELERREASARDDARLHEAMRLALWRMDSTLAPVLAQEAARPVSDYPVAGGPPVPPRPSPSGAFKAWFAVDAAGRVTPPEVAPFAATLRPPAEKPDSKPALDKGVVDFVETAKNQPADDQKKDVQLKSEIRKVEERRAEAPPELERSNERDQAGYEKRREILGRLSPESRASRTDAPAAPGLVLPPAPMPPPPKALDELAAAAASRSSMQRTLDDVSQVHLPQMGVFQQMGSTPQVEQSQGEYQSRVRMAQSAKLNAWASNSQTFNPQTVTPDADTPAGFPLWTVDEAGALDARWLTSPGGTPELFLVRTVQNASGGPKVTQGVWCDWEKLQTWVLESTRDLFPDGRLAPAPEVAASDQAAMLATIPARFVPGAVPPPPAAAAVPAPTRTILALAWIAAIGAIAAVGGVLRAAMSLGDRRGRFVSAVTHELRTPLTTFRMYSQMLADGMVPEGAEPEYLATLKQESERLTRVVESVLLYSRLEEGRGGAHRETIACRALVDRVLPALVKRASDAGMTPVTTIEVAPDAKLIVDAQAVEQILLNLVDNACKYAAPDDARLELLWQTDGRSLRVRCRDFGAGIPDAERDLVFLPFSRGSKDAAGTTPGVGLGLALARGLARALGGDLVLESAANVGAAFLLTLPLAA